MNRQTRNSVIRSLLSAAARLEAAAQLEARVSMERGGVMLRKALKTLGLAPAVTVRLTDTLMNALVMSDMSEVHKVDALAAMIRLSDQMKDQLKNGDAPEPDDDLDSTELPSFLDQARRKLRKALALARVSPKLATGIADVILQGIAAPKASPDVKRSLLNTVIMDIESAMVGVPATQPSVTNPESKKTKRKAKLVEATTAVQQQISEGRLRGTVKQHVRIARAFVQMNKANLSSTHAEISSLAPAGAKVKARFKTLDSAVGKVARKPKDWVLNENDGVWRFVKGKGYARADQLQDGTGVRIVTTTLKDVADTVRAVKEAFDIVEEDDYITRPKSDGYRSHHLIYTASDGLTKELQVRTENQHIFAEWCHDVYKADTPAQKAVMEAEGEAVRAYMLAVSDLLNQRDLGKNPPVPPCPPAVRKAFGCIE